MLISTPWSARYFLSRAQRFDDASWLKWSQENQSTLLKLDEKTGLMTQWIRWGAQKNLVNRLLDLGCHTHATDKTPSVWKFLFENLKKAPDEKMTDLEEKSFQDIVILLIKARPCKESLDRTMNAIQSCVRPLLHGEPPFKATQLKKYNTLHYSTSKTYTGHHATLLNFYSEILFLQVETLGLKKSIDMSPSLPHALQEMKKWLSPISLPGGHITLDLVGRYPVLEKTIPLIESTLEKIQLLQNIPAPEENNQSRPTRRL